MTSPVRLRSWLLGLAVGVCLILLISPATRWLVRAQAAATGLTWLTPDAQGRRAENARRAFIARHPDDFQIQLAAAVGSRKAQVVERLRALVPRFGSGPSLYATLLRDEIGSPPDAGSHTQGPGVYLSRAEDWALGSQPPPKNDQAPPPPASNLLAAYDADAADGERLDPDNAYFPLMRAVGLFAAHRDTEGLAAVLRAGQKHSWQEYIQDETNGRLRLADSMYGHNSVLGRVAITSSILFPHYAAMRGVARVSIALAAQAERGGQMARGLAIRQAIMHSGSLMRAGSSSYMGSLVGIAIAAIATARPGGAPPPAFDSHLVGEQMAQRRLQAFTAYARRIGHPEVARQAQAEAAAGDAVRAIWKKVEDRSIFGSLQFIHLGLWWYSNLVTLANAFWLLLLGAVAAGLSRLPSVREERPVPRPMLWGILGALLVVVGVALSMAFEWLFLLWLTLLVIVLMAWLMRGTRENGPERRPRVGMFFRAFGLTALVLLVLGGLAVWQAQGVGGFAVSALGMVSDVFGSDSGATVGVPQAPEAEVMAVVGSLALPLLMALVLSIAGRARRVPVSAALVRGFRAAAIPTAFLLVILYGALVLGTLRRERRIDAGLQQMVQSEGRYYAALAGMPWPGPTLSL